jgi:hypothetical protein
MRILGQFRDLDRPDWFVWLRGFPNMAAALADFYHGPIWAEHRDAANSTMVDSDNVLLLRPARSHDPQWEPQGGFAVVEIAVRALARGGEERELEHVHERVTPAARRLGASPVAVLVTEPAPNGFPALRVREGESVAVTVLGFADATQQCRYREFVGPEDETQLLRLAPTHRSRLGASR